LRAAAVVAQHRERDEVARAKAERRERGLRADPSETREMVEQRRCRGSVAGGVGRSGDDPSLGQQTASVLQLVCKAQMSSDE
jgi:hypothetical protein